MKYADKTFYKLLGDYLLLYLPSQKNASPHTVKSHKDTLNLFLDYMKDVKGIPTEKVGFDAFIRENVEEFLIWLQNSRQCKSATCNLRLSGIRAFTKYAASMDIAKQFIHASLTDIPPITLQDAKIVDYLSPSAMQTVMVQPDTSTLKGLRNLFYMVLLYDTAARDSELLNLRLRDILHNGEKYSVVLYGKGRKTRILSLESKTVNYYLRYLEQFHPIQTWSPDAYLFYTVIHGARNRMSDDCVGRFIKLYGSMAHKINPEVPEVVHPHQFRHTRAMHLYQNGMQLQELQQILGHANLSTVLTYASADAEMKRKAIEKATISNRIVKDAPVAAMYKDNDEMIRKLCGLR